MDPGKRERFMELVRRVKEAYGDEPMPTVLAVAGDHLAPECDDCDQVATFESPRNLCTRCWGAWWFLSDTEGLSDEEKESLKREYEAFLRDEGENDG